MMLPQPRLASPIHLDTPLRSAGGPCLKPAPSGLSCLAWSVVIVPASSHSATHVYSLSLAPTHSPGLPPRSAVARARPHQRASLVPSARARPVTWINWCALEADREHGNALKETTSLHTPHSPRPSLSIKVGQATDSFIHTAKR